MTFCTKLSIRGQILSLKEQEYVLAARTAGAKGKWIIMKHLFPNCIGIIVVYTALQIPSAIFTESYLSFLGLGVNAPMPSLGSLTSDALNGINSYGYRLVIPAIVISLILFHPVGLQVLHVHHSKIIRSDSDFERPGQMPRLFRFQRRKTQRPALL